MDSSFPLTSDTKIIIHKRIDDKMNQPSRILPVLQKIRHCPWNRFSKPFVITHPLVVNLVGIHAWYDVICMLHLHQQKEKPYMFPTPWIIPLISSGKFWDPIPSTDFRKIPPTPTLNNKPLDFGWGEGILQIYPTHSFLGTPLIPPFHVLPLHDGAPQGCLSVYNPIYINIIIHCCYYSYKPA